MDETCLMHGNKARNGLVSVREGLPLVLEQSQEQREADARHTWPEHIRNKRYAAGRPSDFRPSLGACTESQLPLTAFRTHTPGVPR